VTAAVEPMLRTTRQLAHLLLPLAPHVSTDEALPVLHHLQFRREAGQLQVTATDRYTLLTVTVDDPGPDVEVLVAASDFAELGKVLRAALRYESTSKPVHLGVFEAGVAVKIGKAEPVTYPAAQGFTYPKHRIMHARYENPDEEDSAVRPFDLAINARYVGRFAELHDEGKVEMVWRGPNVTAPILVRPLDPENRYPIAYRGLIMPIRRAQDTTP
jgi:hypothetical protein